MGKETLKNKVINQGKIREKLKEEKQRGSRLIAISGDKKNNEYFLIYHLDRGNGQIINLETKIEDKKAERVINIFENADLYERECKEMYALNFGEEMRNLFLPEGVEEPTKKKLIQAMGKKGEEDA